MVAFWLFEWKRLFCGGMTFEGLQAIFFCWTISVLQGHLSMGVVTSVQDLEKMGVLCVKVSGF